MRQEKIFNNTSAYSISKTVQNSLVIFWGNTQRNAGAVCQWTPQNRQMMLLPSRG